MTTFEEGLILKLSDLKRKGFFEKSYASKEAYHRKNFDFHKGCTWTNIKAIDSDYFSLFSEEFSLCRITIEAQTGIEGAEFVRLNYFAGNERQKIFVELTRKASNLGRGFRYYFICPQTKASCSALYLPPSNKAFASRGFFPDARYNLQTVSRLNKLQNQIFSYKFAQESFDRRYQKNTYQGKLTSTFIRQQKKLIKAQKLEAQYIEEVIRFVLR